MNKLNKKILFHIFINIGILILFYFFYLISINYKLIENPEKVINLSNILVYISIVLISYYFLLWGQIVKTWFNFYSMFLISFYLFTLGQPLLYALDFNPVINIFEREPIENIVVAQFYTIICLVSFYIGGLLTAVKSKTKKTIKNKDNYLIVFRNIGNILFVITIPFILYYLVTRFNYTVDYGYSSFYNNRENESLLLKISDFMSIYFVIALLLLMIGYKDNKNISKIITIIVVFYVLSLFIIGDRAKPTGILLILFWFKTNILKTVNFKANLKILLLVIVLLFIYPIIGDLRNQQTINLSEIKDKQDEENFIIESIGTFGYSIFPLVKTMEIIPETEEYHYGSSYLYSLTTVIPNISKGEHIGAKNASLGQWLKNKLKMTSGPGYSIPAEAYYNFGWFPVPIMILYGVLFALFLTLRLSDRDNYLKLFVVFAFFYMNIAAPRGQFIGMVRDMFYVILPIYVVLVIYINKYKAFLNKNRKF